MVTGFVQRTKGKVVTSSHFMAQGGEFATSIEDAITATASGTQATSRLLVQQHNRVTTVTTAADGVRLPPAFPGMWVVVVNDAATNAMNVWPASATQGGIAGGDKINALGVNAAYSQTVASGVTIFYCFTAGFWRTK